ncbi:hypothetical protein BJ322DRAFT_1148650 [Thelephora terrestris]|uniref:MYND-type domain-containing protein n=1 Tax=Thelephora terrestris TaxID=56493 RepID=A0A9P6HQ85_9AGAM|nr:hypothetical protein BJ322DRAFT_1148650 [Thelephora terrestris]
MAPLREIPTRATQILAKPGFIAGADALELRNLLADLTWILLQTPDKLGGMCLSGDLVGALEMLTARSGRPDPTWRPQPLGHTYVDLLVIGYTGRGELLDEQKENYVKLLNILLSTGVPIDSTDFSGKTALHHAAKASKTVDLIKVLLKYKFNVDSQDRFGASPLLIAVQEDAIDVIPVLLDAGASLDVTDAEGSSPRSAYLTRPAKVSNVVKNWLVRHKGKGAALERDRCSKCGTSSASMKRCSRCRSQLYCSPGCQSELLWAKAIVFHSPLFRLAEAADWKEHKANCQPFDKEENLLVVKPTYTFGDLEFVSTVSTVPSSFGLTRGPNPSGKLEANVRDGRNMVIKIQLPLGNTGGMLVYNRKRNFECILDYDENPAAYTRLVERIKAKGILGLKAYFPAELRSKDELAINVAECLPESRF